MSHKRMLKQPESYKSRYYVKYYQAQANACVSASTISFLQLEKSIEIKFQTIEHFIRLEFVFCYLEFTKES